jgi:hypothetical protein
VLEKDRINLYRAIFYIVVVLSIPVVAYKDYQHWLNPLDLKPEQNPKQHDGSQEFQRPIEFESSVQPAPNEDGVTVYPQLGSEKEFVMSPEDQQVFEELDQKEDYPHEIPVDQ